MKNDKYIKYLSVSLPWLACLLYAAYLSIHIEASLRLVIEVFFVPFEVPALNLVACLLFSGIALAAAHDFRFKIAVLTVLSWLYLMLMFVSVQFLTAASV